MLPQLLLITPGLVGRPARAFDFRLRGLAILLSFLNCKIGFSPGPSSVCLGGGRFGFCFRAFVDGSIRRCFSLSFTLRRSGSFSRHARFLLTFERDQTRVFRSFHCAAGRG